jgi:2'-5' RNA ligase
LPPRELHSGLDQISRQLAKDLQEFSKFSLELTEVTVFATTSVVYLALGDGCEEIIRMHNAVNRSALGADETHQFVPHITLAQDLMPEQLPEIAARARRRWSEYRDQRSFEVDRLTFVQNTSSNCWQDLQEFRLPDMALVGV